MQVGDEWSISYGDAMQVWGLLVTVPNLKDAAWPQGGLDWVSWQINPARSMPFSLLGHRPAGDDDGGLGGDKPVHLRRIA